MRKLLISVLAVSMMVLPLAAQSTRTDSMSLGGNDVPDIGNILTFPELIGMYQNKVWINRLDGSYDEMAILLMELQDYTVGIALVDTVDAVNPGPIAVMTMQPDNSPAWDAEAIAPDITLHALFAGAMGTGTVGANLFWATKSDKYEERDQNLTDPSNVLTDAESVDSSASYLGAILGYGMEEVGPFASVDVSVGIGLPGFESTYEDPVQVDPDNPSDGLPEVETVEKDGGMDLGINVLAVQERSDDTTLRCQLAYGSTALDTACSDKEDNDASGAYDDTAFSDSQEKSLVKVSVSDLGARVAMNKIVNDDELLVVAAGLNRMAISAEYLAEDYNITEEAWETWDSGKWEASALYVPVAIAVEGKIRDEVTLRVGASKDVLVMESETDMDEDWAVNADGDWAVTDIEEDEWTDRFASDVSVSLGVGVELGNFVIDALMSSDILFSGPYSVTGVQGTDFASQIDISYAW